jgi:class 3 adenylate cyclase
VSRNLPQGEDEGDDHANCDADIEEEWALQGMRLNIVIGCQTLLFLLFVTSGSHMYKFAGVAIRHWQCGGIEVDDLEYYVIAEIVFVLGEAALLMACLYRPIVHLYLPLLFLASCHCLALGLPPFTISCRVMLDIAVCKTMGNTTAQSSNSQVCGGGWFLDQESCGMGGYAHLRESNMTTILTQAIGTTEEDVNALDCSMLGISPVQMHMMWILVFTPRVIPSRELMWFNWFWMFVMYFGVVLWSQSNSPEPHIFTLADVGVTLCLFIFANVYASQRKFFISKSQKNKFLSDWREFRASEKMYCILEYMLPVHLIVPMLEKADDAVLTQDHTCVSILFVVIVDFDHIATQYTPNELLAFLNKYFNQFDQICTRHEVTKIETVGEEYVAAVGVVPDANGEFLEESKHHEGLGRLIRAAAEMLRLQDAEARFKMGLHTGPIVAGVIGKKLPRFRLFGDTINTAARMMQKGEPGELQMGEETRKRLPGWVKLGPRRLVEMKGKGEVSTYFLDHEEDHFGDDQVDRPISKSFQYDAEERRISITKILLGQQEGLPRFAHTEAAVAERRGYPAGDATCIAPAGGLSNLRQYHERRSMPMPMLETPRVQADFLDTRPSLNSRPSRLRRSLSGPPDLMQEEDDVEALYTNKQNRRSIAANPLLSGGGSPPSRSPARRGTEPRERGESLIQQAVRVAKRLTITEPTSMANPHRKLDLPFRRRHKPIEDGGDQQLQPFVHRQLLPPFVP